MKKEIKTIEIKMSVQEAKALLASGCTDIDQLASAYIAIKKQRDALDSSLSVVGEVLADKKRFTDFFGNAEPVQIVNGPFSVTLSPSEVKSFVVDKDKLIEGELPAGVITTEIHFNNVALKKLYMNGDTSANIQEACSFNTSEIVKIKYTK